ALGHAPINALINPKNGSKMAIAESLTNIVWAPFKDGLKSVSLSANWMWPCKNEGEDARLYEAVEAVSDFACNLGINIPTGKDSLSMVQKYRDDAVYAPGTVIISASGEVSDVKKVVEPTLVNEEETSLILVDFSKGKFDLGGSSFAQVLNKIGDSSPTVNDDEYFARAFNAVQKLITDGKVLAGHDISSGGLITTLLEMNFPNSKGGLKINFSSLEEKDLTKILFSEIAAVVIQVKDSGAVVSEFGRNGIHAHIIGVTTNERTINIKHHGAELNFDINEMRDVWYKTSYLLDQKQATEALATEHFDTYKNTILDYKFPENFTGKLSDYAVEHGRKSKTGIKAAIIREKGVNGDREMAYSLFLAGFDVKDIHMTDLISGREDLSDVNMIVYVGGFSNSDVLGSAKGWAGAFLYNPKAKLALDNFYARPDTLSLGVCNGCQLMMELGLIESKGATQPMQHNASGKFESGYLNVEVPENNSIMLKSLAGSKLGIWVAHGEGRFLFEGEERDYNISMKYSHDHYPANPNASEYDAAGICSNDGRHLAMMPHLERIIFTLSI
ncbi:MAG: phosphoribosylformylglycinamidine synthase subunit PurQ, partial [Vicingaceae bacterium]